MSGQAAADVPSARSAVWGGLREHPEPHEVATSTASPSAIKAGASRGCSCNTVTPRTTATSGSSRINVADGAPNPPL
jgi:hypothetical protein